MPREYICKVVNNGANSLGGGGGGGGGNMKKWRGGVGPGGKESQRGGEERREAARGGGGARGMRSLEGGKIPSDSALGDGDQFFCRAGGDGGRRGGEVRGRHNPWNTEVG